MHKNSTLSPPIQNVNFFLGVQGHENQLLVKESLCYRRVVGFGDKVPKLRGLIMNGGKLFLHIGTPYFETLQDKHF